MGSSGSGSVSGSGSKNLCFVDTDPDPDADFSRFPLSFSFRSTMVLSSLNLSSRGQRIYCPFSYIFRAFSVVGVQGLEPWTH